MNDPTPKAEAVANYLGRDILALIVGELKNARKPWHQLTEGEQETVIRRAEQDARSVLRKGFMLIVAADFQKATATLDKVAFTAKGVVGSVTLKGSREEFHTLADCAGRDVVVILTSAEAYLEKMNEIRGEVDQPGLPLEIVDPTDTGDDEVLGDEPGLEILDDPDEEVLHHEAGLSFDCVRDVLALVGIECSPEIVATWDEATRRAVIDYAGARHIAETSADYLTKGGTVPPLPEVLGGGA